MWAKRIVNYIKKLYGVDINPILLESYKELNNLGLIKILNEPEHHLRSEARELASQILAERLNLQSNFSISEALDIEINKINELSEKCHLCQSTNISESTPFLLCQQVGKHISLSEMFGSLLASCITMPTIGVGGFTTTTTRNYKVIELSLNMCELCIKKNSRKRLFRKPVVNVTKDLCYKHPKIQLYQLYGFDEIFWPSELSRT